MTTKQDVIENVDILVPALVQRIAHVEAYLQHLKNALNGTVVITNVPELTPSLAPQTATVHPLTNRLTA
jgi:hypothetical protein